VSAHPVSAKGAETRVGQPSFRNLHSPALIPQPSFPNWKLATTPATLHYSMVAALPAFQDLI
jgi:hypothetical protein